MGYPKNGSDYGLIDDLIYQYTGNRLQKVDDANNPACQNNGFSDNGSFTNNEYLYDLNGNMIQDLNKEIGNIDYTFNNLPERVVLSTIEEEDIIYFWYDASGQKLRKQTRTDGAIVATTDYTGSFVYENGFLQYILTDEGRIVYDRFNDTYQYQYFLKDHLGNTRILFDENGTVLQDNSYYPFGMAIDALCHSENFTPDNNYLYNGKELQDDFGLEWYDYGKRMYDPALGRWHVPDPIAEKYESLSPYNYALNNPLYFIDPDGDTVKTAGASEQAAYNDYKNEVNRRVTHYQGKVAAQQTKVANAKTGFGRFFANTGLKTAQRSLSTYQGIQGEISNMESSTTTFMVRMGSNIVAPLPSNSAGSTTFNIATNQVDINIGSSSMFTTRQIVSHELLHGNQYLNGDLDFDATGLGGGLFYDKTDETATFTRQNLFAPSSSNVVDVSSTVNTYYPSLDKGPKSFHLLTPIQQTQYNTLKSKGRVH